MGRLWQIVKWRSRWQEMNRRKHTGQLWALHEGQLREADYWIVVSEKVVSGLAVSEIKQGVVGIDF